MKLQPMASVPIPSLLLHVVLLAAFTQMVEVRAFEQKRMTILETTRQEPVSQADEEVAETSADAASKIAEMTKQKAQVRAAKIMQHVEAANTDVGVNNHEDPPPCQDECDAAQEAGWNASDAQTTACAEDELCSACVKCVQISGPPSPAGGADGGANTNLAAREELSHFVIAEGMPTVLVSQTKLRQNDCGTVSNASSFLQRPGAGMVDTHPFVPFEVVIKSGFSQGECILDYMYHHGDKFGSNKRAYKSDVDVSIVKYNDWVAKPSRLPMTREVCFDFCKSVPDMQSFGLINGRECYCGPFAKQMAGDSSMCNVPCAGVGVSSTADCGGVSKSRIFPMFDCSPDHMEVAAAQVLGMEVRELGVQALEIFASTEESMNEYSEAHEKTVVAHAEVVKTEEELAAALAAEKEAEEAAAHQEKLRLASEKAKKRVMAAESKWGLVAATASPKLFAKAIDQLRKYAKSAESPAKEHYEAAVPRLMATLEKGKAKRAALLKKAAEKAAKAKAYAAEVARKAKQAAADLAAAAKKEAKALAAKIKAEALEKSRKMAEAVAKAVAKKKKLAAEKAKAALVAAAKLIEEKAKAAKKAAKAALKVANDKAAKALKWAQDQKKKAWAAMSSWRRRRKWR